MHLKCVSSTHENVYKKQSPFLLKIEIKKMSAIISPQFSRVLNFLVYFLVVTAEIATQTESICEREKEMGRGVIPHVVINQDDDHEKDTLNNPDSIDNHNSSSVVQITRTSDASPSYSAHVEEPSKEFQASDHVSILDSHLFVKRNFLSSSWCNLESHAAIRLASYEKTSPNLLRKSMAV